MRPGQNKRMRGRNNRKGPNPLTRTYESNGPDVKIRGTAHHVAEKYLQLARDAQSSGDPVMAESYLQHAEHYFRLIAAAQQAQQQAQVGYVRQPGDPEPDEIEDDDDGGMPDRFASPLERMQPAFNPQQPPYPQQAQPPHQAQQPYGERPQYNNNERPQQDRPYQDRGPRQDRQQFQDRNQRNGQNRGPRDQQRNQRDFRNDQQPRFDARPEPRPAPIPAPQPEIDAAPPGLPSFITAPVRVAPPEVSEQPMIETAAAPRQEEGAEPGRFHLRNRRRRPRNAVEGGDEGRAAETSAGDVPVAE